MKRVYYIALIMFVLWPVSVLFAGQKTASDKVTIDSIGIPFVISDSKKAWSAFNHFRSESAEETEKILGIAFAGADKDDKVTRESIAVVNKYIENVDYETNYLYILLAPCQKDGINVIKPIFYNKGGTKLIHAVDHADKTGNWGYLRMYVIKKDEDILDKVVFLEGKMVETALFENGIDINSAAEKSLYKMKEGFAYTVNKESTNFSVLVKAVDYSIPSTEDYDSENSFIFMEEDTVFQIVDPSYEQFYTGVSGDAEDKTILTRYMNWEKNFFESNVRKKTESESKFIVLENGKVCLNWSYTVPAGGALEYEKAVGDKVIFCSVVAGKSVLSVNATVKKKEDEGKVRVRLVEIMNNVYLSKSPITHKMVRKLADKLEANSTVSKGL